MKIREITVGNYKKFIEPLTVSFCDEEGNVNDMNLVLGENGSGKTSILQAIVATIAPLTRPGFHVQDLDWNGFNYRYIQTGRTPLKIDIKMDLTPREIQATQAYFDELKGMDTKNRFKIRPSQQETVSLSLDYARRKTVAESDEQLFQLYGYQYAKQLSQFNPNPLALYDDVGSIFWYTENRNAFSISSPFVENDSPDRANNLDAIRSSLTNFYYFHLDLSQGRRALKEGQVDFYEKLDKLYRKVFPTRHLVGAAPRFDASVGVNTTPDFFLSDGQNQYELSEMSAGERAIFPILMDFARYNINNSIIIIDEIELHLHSPLQQALVRALPLLGNNNQFILTSHSDNVVVMFNKDEIIRL